MDPNDTSDGYSIAPADSEDEDFNSCLRTNEEPKSKSTCVICMAKPSTIAFLHGDRYAHAPALTVCASVCMHYAFQPSECACRLLCSMSPDISPHLLLQLAHVLLRILRKGIRPVLQARRRKQVPVLPPNFQGSVQELHCMRSNIFIR